MPVAVVVRNCAGCGVRFEPTGPKQAYHDERCRNTAEKRRQRARKRGDLELVPTITDRPRVDRDHSQDGRGSARRPPSWFLDEDYPGQVGTQAEVELGRKLHTVGSLAQVLGKTPAEVSRWVTWWLGHRDELEARKDWTPPDAGETVDDFIAFRTAHFQTRQGKPYLTAGFHRRWIASILQAIDRGGRLQILSPPRMGKAIAVDTPMFTSRGWVNAGEVTEGDELVGSDGRFTKVLGVFPQGVTDAWRVTFTDHTSLVTSPDHRWEVRQRYGGPARVLTTAQLRDDLTEADGRCKWRIPVAAPFEGAHRSLPIDPYLLGVWLGDGTSKRPEITTADPEVVAAFEAEGFTRTYRYDGSSGRASTYGFAGLKRRLRLLGVLGNKHVPDRYLHASDSQRLALLQGLCDTDGTAAANGSQQSYCTTSERLAEAFKWLVVSLGGVYYVQRRTTSYQSHGQTLEGRPSETIHFRLPKPMCAFRLARKADRMVAATNRSEAMRVPRRFVEAITPEPAQETVCFAVDAADNLFAAGRDLILTHNTDLLIHFCIWLILRNPNISIIWVGATAELAERAVSQVKSMLTNNRGLIAAYAPPGGGFKPDGRSGVEWSSKKFTVATRTVDHKSPTIVAVGKGGTLQSRDADFIVTDDLQDEDDAQSPTQLQKDWAWWEGDLDLREEADTAWLNIGSRSHPDDIAGQLLEDPEWDSIVERAHNDTDADIGEQKACVNRDSTHPDHHVDCLLFPEVRDWVYLRRKRRNRSVWQLKWQNDPVDAGFTRFDEEQLRACRNPLRSIGQYPQGCILVGGLDPATSGFQAAVLHAIQLTPPKRYVVDTSDQEAGGTDGAYELIVAWFVRYGLRTWFVEANGMQGLYLSDPRIRKFCQDNGIRLIPHQTQHNKNDPDYGVMGMVQLFGYPQGHPLAPNGMAPQVDFPYGSSESQEKTDALIGQFKRFTGRRNRNTTRGYRTDLVMAFWFPEHYIQTLKRGAVKVTRAPSGRGVYLTRDVA